MNEDQEIAELLKTAKDHFDKENYNQAIKDYDKAIELKPNYAYAYNNRGIAYNKKGNYDQAIKDYDEAISLNPNYADACNNRENVYDNFKLPSMNEVEALINKNKTPQATIQPNHVDKVQENGTELHKR